MSYSSNIFLRSLKNNVDNLLLNPGLSKQELFHFIQNNNFLSNDTKTTLISFCQSQEIHPVLNITFCQLAQVVFNNLNTNNQVLQNIDFEFPDDSFFGLTHKFTCLIDCLHHFKPNDNNTKEKYIRNIIYNHTFLLKQNNIYSSDKLIHNVSIHLKNCNFINEYKNDLDSYLRAFIV